MSRQAAMRSLRRKLDYNGRFVSISMPPLRRRTRKAWRHPGYGHHQRFVEATAADMNRCGEVGSYFGMQVIESIVAPAGVDIFPGDLVMRP